MRDGDAVATARHFSACEPAMFLSTRSRYLIGINKCHSGMLTSPFYAAGPVLLLALNLDDLRCGANHPAFGFSEALTFSSILPLCTHASASALPHLPGEISNRRAHADQIDPKQNPEQP